MDTNKWINYAIRLTKESAEVKDWRLTNKKMRELREIARNTKEGYIVATPVQMYEKYPNLMPAPGNSPNKEETFVWAIKSDIHVWADGKRRFFIDFCPIASLEGIV